MPRLILGVAPLMLLGLATGCATIKQSDTPRTGIEQMMISNAVDQALDKIDYTPLAGRKVHVNATFLDCVDKNYIIVSLHQRLLQTRALLVDKPEEADAILEVASGAVGTDRQEFFIGVPELPLPPPSPIMIPKMTVYSRAKGMGTAKLRVIAYDVKSRQPLVDSGISLARADYRNWNVLGAGPGPTGKIPTELVQHTGEGESLMELPDPAKMARQPDEIDDESFLE